MKKGILSEKNLVVVLFAMVLITFSLAQEDTKNLEKLYLKPNKVSAESSPEKISSPIAEQENYPTAVQLR